MSEPVLVLDGLVRHFDDVRAVDRVSFTVARGEVLGFIGPNGAGKTTTMRMLATLDTPQDGDGWVNGHSIVDEPEEVRRITGFMPDYAGVYANTTVREYLDFFARAHGLRGARRAGAVENIIDFMEIGELAGREIEKLSKGLKQRVALGRALVHDPDLLILDEPAANLDPRARIEFRTLVRELAADGKSVLLSSHILTELAEMCDTVAVIDKGRVLATGTVAEILARMRARHVLSVRVADATAKLEAFLLEQPGVDRVREVGGRVQFEFSGDDAAQAALVGRMVGAGFAVVEVVPQHGGLEELFIEDHRRDKVSVLAWLDSKSDWLSPIVVKEVRQMVRGREFGYSFLSIVAVSLLIAAWGASDALESSRPAGGWVFQALMTGLTFLCLTVVPLGAFNALRHERLEQTLDLMTITTLTARRLVVGKLLAQAVKLMLFFAAAAPFIAMSFLLGGIDLLSILSGLAFGFMVSLWVCAICLFLSSLAKSAAASGFLFAGVAVVLLIVFAIGRIAFTALLAPGRPVAFGTIIPRGWWAVAMFVTFWLMTTANVVLLAENRLTLPTANRVTALRVGFLAQFVLVLGAFTPWLTAAMRGVPGSPYAITSRVNQLVTIAGLHLSLAALFTLSEDLVAPRRVLARAARSRLLRRIGVVLSPGAGPGAMYVLLQMTALVAVIVAIGVPGPELRRLLAVCCYVCLFTGVPALVFRLLKPAGRPFNLRLVMLLGFAAVVILPVFATIAGSRSGLTGALTISNLINPLRTFTNWQTVEDNHWFPPIVVMGGIGAVSYGWLMVIARRATARAVTRSEVSEPGPQAEAHPEAPEAPEAKSVAVAD